MTIPEFEHDGVIIEHFGGSGTSRLVVNTFKSVELGAQSESFSVDISQILRLSPKEIDAVRLWVEQYREILYLWLLTASYKLSDNQVARLLAWEALSDEDRDDVERKMWGNKRSGPLNSTNVYLMQDAITGYYKIGRSINPEFRERTLLAQAPKIELVCYWRECTADDERNLHQCFLAYRKRGEWFELTDKMLSAIDRSFEQSGKEKVFHRYPTEAISAIPIQ